MQTKHEQVIAYIEALEVDEKVSVRQLARTLQVSEGTVYRAIKEAETRGLVTSIPKVGTIRIEATEMRAIESLTYHELVFLLEGHMLFGSEWGEETPRSYYVATALDKLEKADLHPNTLVITENNADIIATAVDAGYAILLADDTQLVNHEALWKGKAKAPVLSTPYEIFETVSAINQAIFERVKTRELVRITDIMTRNPYTLSVHDTVSDWNDLHLKTGHSRFPVVDKEGKLEGILTSQDITNESPATPIFGLMSPTPMTVRPEDLVSYLARLLVWESIELVPVVDQDNVLIGVVSRQDVIEALQSVQKQPQWGDTVDNITMSGFSLVDEDEKVFLRGKLTEFMVDESGEASTGTLATIAVNTAVIAIRQQYGAVSAVKQFNLQRFFTPLRAEQTLDLSVTLYHKYAGSYQAIVEFNIDGTMAALATMFLSKVE